MTIFAVVTSNGIEPLEIKLDDWSRKSRQEGKRHPLDPLGRCMTCGDHKLGFWEWHAIEPDDNEERAK